jgi:CBS domain-containing protein
MRAGRSPTNRSGIMQMDETNKAQAMPERSAPAGRDRGRSEAQAGGGSDRIVSGAPQGGQTTSGGSAAVGRGGQQRESEGGQGAGQREGFEPRQEGLRRSFEAERGAVRRGGEAVEQGAHGAAEFLRHSAEIGRRGGEAMAETTRHGLGITSGSQDRLMQHAAEEMERTGHRLALVAQEAAEGVRSLMALPAFSAEGMRQAQHAMTQLLEGVATTNLRVTQEWMRRSGPSSLVDLQRRFLREYFDALAEGGWQLLRVARQAAEDSLHPLEDQIRQRRFDGERGGYDEEGRGRMATRRPNGDGGWAAAGRREGGGGEDRSALVSEVMSRDVRLASPEDTVQQVARIMGEEDTGIVPIGEGDRLVGMVTDRDLAVRLVAAGRDPSRTKVREVMSPEIRYVFEDEPVRHVSDVMAEQQVHRLPVLNRQKRLVGIVSIGDIARRNGEAAGEALRGISRPGGRHAQHLPEGPGTPAGRAA